MYNSTCFQSPRLKTRPLQDSDANRLYAIYSDHDAMKYRGSSPMCAIADAQRMITHQVSKDGDVEKTRLALIKKSENLLIGTLLLVADSKKPTQIEIGFSIDREQWNRGFGNETVQMLVEHFKGEERFTDLKAWTKKENFASIKILERNGFERIEQSEYPESYCFAQSIIPQYALENLFRPE